MNLNPLRPVAAILVASCVWLAQPALAQEAEALGGIAEARVLGDHVLVRVVLSTEEFHKETHIVLDYAEQQPIKIYNCILGAVKFGEGEETLKILADGLRLEVPKEGVTASQESTPLLKYLSNRYSIELEEIDVAAILGGPVLKQFALGMNLDEGSVSFTLAAEADVAEAQMWSQAIITGLSSTEDGRVLTPVTYGDGQGSHLAFDTTGYHSYINADVAAALERPSGDVPGIFFGAGDQRMQLSGMAALFPADFSENPGASPDWLLVPGLSLWTAYRLEINPVQGYLALAPVVNSNYSEADFAFYSAAVAKDRGALRTYLEENLEDRNVAEAAQTLFKLGLEEDASAAEQMEAVNWRLSATLERMKADWITGTVGSLFMSEQRDQRTDLIVALAEDALQYIARSDNPALRQDLQLMLGDRYLYAGDAQEAWKNFLAAGFNGDPKKDAFVRHELGRAYEALGRNRRAYSSYQRAASPLADASPQIKESARAGMQRLKALLDDDDPLLAQGGQ